MNLDTTIIMISHSDTSLEYFDKVIDLNDFKQNLMLNKIAK